MPELKSADWGHLNNDIAIACRAVFSRYSFSKGVGMLKRHQILLASVVMTLANLSYAQANNPAQPTVLPPDIATTSSQAQDPYVQRRAAKKQAKEEYKAAKKQAKQEYKADKREANAQLKAATQPGSGAPQAGN
jgi:hypothetical protein